VENRSGQAIKISMDVTGSRGVAYSSSPTWILDGSTLLYSGDDTGANQLSGLGLLAADESATVWVGLVASFNDPPLLRSIEFVIPSSQDVAVAQQQPH